MLFKNLYNCSSSYKTMSTVQSHWKSRFIAAGIHLGISLGLATLAATLVFVVWYPYPYREISGGRSLFWMVVSIDVIMGPLLTLAVFNRSKPINTLRLDLAIIGVLQLAALGYGLWTVALARPVHLVFEIDRFRAVHAFEVDSELLIVAPPAFQQLPLTGPTLLSVRDFKNADENFAMTNAAFAGTQIGAQPSMWQDYQKAKPQILARARPLEDLKKRFPGQITEIDQALKSASSKDWPAGSVGYIPLNSRDSDFWTVLVDRQTAEVIAFVPIDSF
jgi:hypothetical protein